MIGQDAAVIAKQKAALRAKGFVSSNDRMMSTAHSPHNGTDVLERKRYRLSRFYKVNRFGINLPAVDIIFQNRTMRDET